MKLFCYGKEDITENVNIPKEEWKNVLQEIIISSVKNDEHLGENLKKQCIEYLENLFKEEI